MDKYDVANYFLKEASDYLKEAENPALKGLTSQKDNLKMQIDRKVSEIQKINELKEKKDEELKKLRLSMADLIKKIAQAGGATESITEESESEFERNMLILEKDKIEAYFKERFPGKKITFYKFNEAGLAKGVARIDFERTERDYEELTIKEKKESKIYFTPENIEYVVGDKIVATKSYEDIAKEPMDFKIKTLFDFRFWKQTTPKTKK